MADKDQDIILTSFFDSSYLNRAISLIQSVELQTKRKVVWKLLALDEITFSFLMNNKEKNWDVLKIEDLRDPEVLQLKADRPYREFCWSLSAILLDYILSISKSKNLVAYVDSDCYFFSDIGLLFDTLQQEKDFFIHEHNFPRNKEYLISRSGKFNVGVIGGRVSKQFKQCIEFWRAQVVEKCIIDLENGFCGDQTYLDKWPEKYDRLRILKSNGIGAGPWNINNKNLEFHGKDILVNKDILVFYHFHAFKYTTIFGRLYIFQPAINYRIQRKPLKFIYYPYIKQLNKVSNITSIIYKEISLQKNYFSLLRNLPHFFWSDGK